jgi:hypothetical protein
VPALQLEYAVANPVIQFMGILALEEFIEFLDGASAHAELFIY